MNYAYKLLFKRTFCVYIVFNVERSICLNLSKTSQGSASWLRFYPRNVRV